MTPTRQEIKAAIELGIGYLSTAGDTKAFPAQKALRAHLETFDEREDFHEAAMNHFKIVEIAEPKEDDICQWWERSHEEARAAYRRLIAKDKHADGCRCPECDPNFNDPREASDAGGAE